MIERNNTMKKEMGESHNTKTDTLKGSKKMCPKPASNP